MAGAQELSIILKAEDRASDVLGGIQNKIGGLSGAIQKHHKAIGMGMTAVGSAVVGAAALSIKSFAAMGDEVEKMAHRTGFSAEVLSELRHVADISGASLGSLEKGVRRMAKSLVDADRGLEASKRSFDALGLSTEKLMAMAPEEQFEAITMALAGVENQTLKSALAQEIFGRAGTELLPMLALGEEGIKKLRKEAHELGIVFSQESAATAAEFKDDLTRLQGSLKGVQASIAEALIPTLLPLIEKIAETVKGVQSWIKENPELARVITVVTAAIGGLMLVLGPLMLALPTLITSYGLLKAAKLKAAAATKLLIKDLGALKAAMKAKTAIMAAASKGMIALTAAAKGLKIAIAIMAGPIGLIVAAIAGLIAIGVSLYKNWDEISAKAKEIWGAIASFFGDIWDKITDIFNSAFEFIKKVFLDYHPLGIIISNWEPIKDFLADLWDNITGALKSAWDDIKSFMANLNPWEWMKAGWEALKDGIANILNWIFGGSIINDWASGMMRFLQGLNPWEWMKAGWEALSSGISGIWDRITGIVSEKVNVIQGFLGSVWEKASGLVDFAQAQADRAGALLAGARDAAVGAWQAAERAAAGIVADAKAAIEEKGIVGAVTGAVEGALEQTKKWLPSFQHGGIVPGPIGRPVPILAHGGERVIPVGQKAATVSPQLRVEVHIHNGTFLGDEAEAQRWGDRLGEVLQQKVRMGWSLA